MKHPIGSKVEFTKDLIEHADSEDGGGINTYALRGWQGIIVGHEAKEGFYMVEANYWREKPFGASENEFKLVQE